MNVDIFELTLVNTAKFGFVEYSLCFLLFNQ